MIRRFLAWLRDLFSRDDVDVTVEAFFASFGNMILEVFGETLRRPWRFTLYRVEQGRFMLLRRSLHEYTGHPTYIILDTQTGKEAEVCRHEWDKQVGWPLRTQFNAVLHQGD